ncbi:hypothetical protein [Nitrosococcus watsonii]|uniref:DUF3224 domain-containing protein n=1 Tax=Nitrosococcus watsoni (strain C-113) TaxID=105559 RepID=D8K497_NITWC|nr:hypothetical protein [Nitrosococcus watsonii]ADJ27794.1 hypothetical protein Nwat_0847 [Nitrosococcus watsonii C-113]
MPIQLKIIIPIISLLAAENLLAGETVTYHGTGTYKATQILMPLANGDGILHLTNETIATIEPSERGFIFGDCAGLGHITAAGELSTESYCTFRESDEDAFDLHNKAKGGEGMLEVIGGSGKWEGATGTGTVKRKFTEGNHGTYEYELKIKTP